MKESIKNGFYEIRLGISVVFFGLLTANIILNFTLIIILIKHSALLATVGVAIGTLASRYLLMMLLFYHARKKVGVSIDLNTLLKPLLASGVMFLILFYIISGIDLTVFSTAIVVLSGIGIYFVMMFLMKGIVKGDIEIFTSFFKKARPF